MISIGFWGKAASPILQSVGTIPTVETENNLRLRKMNNRHSSKRFVDLVTRTTHYAVPSAKYWLLVKTEAFLKDSRWLHQRRDEKEMR